MERYRITKEGLSVLAHGEDRALGEVELRVLQSLLDRPEGYAYRTTLNRVYPSRYRTRYRDAVGKQFSESIRLLDRLGYITSKASTSSERLELEYVLGLPEVRRLPSGKTRVGGTTLGDPSDLFNLEEYDAESKGETKDRGISRN